MDKIKAMLKNFDETKAADDPAITASIFNDLLTEINDLDSTLTLQQRLLFRSTIGNFLISKAVEEGME